MNSEMAYSAQLFMTPDARKYLLETRQFLELVSYQAFLTAGDPLSKT